MTTTVSVVTPWFNRPTPLPFDFIGTRRFTEKVTIIEKRDGVYLPVAVPFGGGSGNYSTPAYFVFAMTPFGDIRIDVSKEVYDLLEIGKELIISYRRGRWTGALKGDIAR